jgi:hypothetical protein
MNDSTKAELTKQLNSHAAKQQALIDKAQASERTAQSLIEEFFVVVENVIEPVMMEFGEAVRENHVFSSRIHRADPRTSEVGNPSPEASITFTLLANDSAPDGQSGDSSSPSITFRHGRDRVLIDRAIVRGSGQKGHIGQVPLAQLTTEAVETQLLELVRVTLGRT